MQPPIGSKARMATGKRRLEAAAENMIGRSLQSYQNVSRETLWYDYGVFNRPASPKNFDLCKGRFETTQHKKIITAVRSDSKNMAKP